MSYEFYSLQLSPSDAWAIACAVNEKANAAFSRGETDAGTHLYNLAVRLSSFSFQADLMGYDKEDLIELNCRQKTEA